MSFYADPPDYRQHPCPYCGRSRTAVNASCSNCGWEPELSDSRSDQIVAVGIGLVLAAALVIKVLRERK